MLPLNDSRWHDLRTSYSRPSRFLPALQRLLDNLTTGPEVVREFNLENYVCHQYTVYETTIAVVPHFVHAASRLPPPKRKDLLTAAGAYALLLGVPPRPSEGPEPPAYLGADYAQAVRTALPLVGETLGYLLVGPEAENDAVGLIVALAGFQGQRRLGVMIASASRRVRCPVCDAEFEPLTEWGNAF